MFLDDFWKIFHLTTVFNIPYLHNPRDIPVDAKLIAEPSMHSMPSITVHPNGMYVLKIFFLVVSLEIFKVHKMKKRILNCIILKGLLKLQIQAFYNYSI